MTTRHLRTAVPVLLLPLTLLTGCDGGSGTPDSQPPTASASEPNVPSASASGAGDLQNPCDVVDQDKIASLMGLEHVKGKPIGGGTTTAICSFFDSKELDAPLLSLQTTMTDDYEQFLTLSRSGMDDPESIDVPGADEAAILVDQETDFPSVTVVAHTPGRLHVAVVGDKTVAAARKLGIEAMTLLVASSS